MTPTRWGRGGAQGSAAKRRNRDEVIREGLKALLRRMEEILEEEEEEKFDTGRRRSSRGAPSERVATGIGRRQKNWNLE